MNEWIKLDLFSSLGRKINYHWRTVFFSLIYKFSWLWIMKNALFLVWFHASDKKYTLRKTVRNKSNWQMCKVLSSWLFITVFILSPSFSDSTFSTILSKWCLFVIYPFFCLNKCRDDTRRDWIMLNIRR